MKKTGRNRIRKVTIWRDYVFNSYQETKKMYDKGQLPIILSTLSLSYKSWYIIQLIVWMLFAKFIPDLKLELLKAKRGD